jgi:hypothetical protein
MLRHILRNERFPESYRVYPWPPESVLAAVVEVLAVDEENDPSRAGPWRDRRAHTPKINPGLRQKPEDRGGDLSRVSA